MNEHIYIHEDLIIANIYRQRRRQRQSSRLGSDTPSRIRYIRADVSSWSDKRCRTMCRFTYTEIERITTAIGLEPVLKFNDLKVTREFAMAVLLCRSSFPRRLVDMVDIFGMSDDNIGRTANRLSDLLLEKFRSGLEFDERQFSKENLKRFSEAIFKRGAFYSNVVGFIDGTMEQTCRPKDGKKQEKVYNGWKHMHCLKFQGVCTPDGITSSLYGPYTGSRNDRGMLTRSQLIARLSAHFESVSPDKRYMLYGDEGYSYNRYLMVPFPKSLCNEQETATNLAMSKVRVSVEMDFGKTAQYFSACKWKYGNKILQTRPGLKYLLSIVFKNFHTCLYGSNVAAMFQLEPPTLEEYISGLMRDTNQLDIDAQNIDA